MKIGAPAVLILISVIGSATFTIVGASRNLSTLENTLLQVFAIAVGIGASIVFGRESAREAAREIVKPHARSAFRRLVSLYKSLSRVANAIEQARPNVTDAMSSAVLDKLGAIVAEQLATADDALEDWNDIVPEDVKELRQRMHAETNQGESNGQ